jgi:hypothetical protein
VNCGGGKTTSLSGTIVVGTLPQYGKPDPVYNAVVYVPTAPVEPFKAGVSCDRCGVAASGSPLVATLTGYDGKFTLTNVPAGDDVPLVVQLGKWRRQIVVPKVAPCADTPLDPQLTRLPRNKSEGDIPQFAIASSWYDVEECVLRKMGVDDAEFTTPAENGRIHLYRGDGPTLPNTAPETDLWASLDTLKKYDVVLLPCATADRGTPEKQRVFDYTNVGGRVFITDLSHGWITKGPAAFQSTAKWVPWGPVNVDPLPALIDQSFPKGMALAAWLQLVGATTTVGSLPILESFHVVDAVNAPTARWVHSTMPATTQTLSFNTPVGAPPDQQCGRAVYSTFHVTKSSISLTPDSNFPHECGPGPLTPQEKILEFLLLDVASCVTPDSMPPPPPPVTPPAPPPPPPPPPR